MLSLIGHGFKRIEVGILYGFKVCLPYQAHIKAISEIWHESKLYQRRNKSKLYQLWHKSKLYQLWHISKPYQRYGSYHIAISEIWLISYSRISEIWLLTDIC